MTQLAVDEACVDALLDVWEKELDAMIDRISDALAEIHNDWRTGQGPLLTESHWATPLMQRYAKAGQTLEKMQRLWASHYDRTPHVKDLRRDRAMTRDLSQAKGP